MAVYHISDTHFGHKNIIKFRPGFETLQEHDEYVRDMILDTLHKKDKLVFHGDLCFHRDALKYVQEIADQIESVELILGNHDLESNQRPSIQDLIDIFGKKIYGMKKYKKVWLTHAPLHPKELRGGLNIHGHVHSNSINEYGFINSCCEALNYRPKEFSKLLEEHLNEFKPRN